MMCIIYLFVSRELSDALLFWKLADEQQVVFLGYDIVVKALYHNFLFLCGMYHAVMCVIHIDVGANEAIAIQIVVSVHI